MPFEKGKSGNPKGRPLGSKNKLAEAFWNDAVKAWELGGATALEKMRDDDPGGFVRAFVSLMPKETEMTLRTVSAQQLGDDELADIAVGGSEGTADAPLDPSQLN